MSNLEQARNWVTSFADTTKSITESDPVKLFQDVKKTFSNLMTEEAMYFYLIDELTGKPLIGDGYPIEITKPSDFVPKMLPFVQCGMRAISLCNGTAGICQMFGFPFPKIPDSIAKEMRECMLILKQSSSVEAFEAVHQKVEDGDGRSTTVRGSSLSVLEDFFTKYDCEKRYAGLRRIAGKDGGAIWTAVPDDDVEKYLRYRIAMRKKEEIENIAALRSIRNEIVENRKKPEEEQEPLNSYCYDCFLGSFSIR